MRAAGSAPATAEKVSAPMTGAARMVWAMIIAEGVKRRSMNPSGPLRESTR